MTKKQWSRPTWFFFHGFAEKINEQFYKVNYVKCFKYIIHNICKNLPCPICKYHASKYIKIVKHKDINTKQKLIQYLFIFHNSVNERVGKRKFEYNILKKYERLKFDKTFNVMYKNITRDYYGQPTMNSWLRKKNMDKTKQFLESISFYINN